MLTRVVTRVQSLVDSRKDYIATTQHIDSRVLCVLSSLLGNKAAYISHPAVSRESTMHT